MGALKGGHIVVLLVVILLLFGAPKLPELARSIGKSLNILKEETRTLTSDKKDGASETGHGADEARDKEV